jgi:hypothetical protein
VNAARAREIDEVLLSLGLAHNAETACLKERMERENFPTQDRLYRLLVDTEDWAQARSVSLLVHAGCR